MQNVAGMHQSADQFLRTYVSEAREVFDVSGAGDTVIAAFSAAIAAGADWREAAMLANAAAGVVVAEIGTATVTPGELLAHYHEQEAN